MLSSKEEAEWFGAETFEARENKDGTIVLTDGEWNRSRYLHNGNYLLWSMELKLLKQLANGAKFEKVAEYNEEELRIVYKYEQALKDQDFKMRMRLKGLEAEDFRAESFEAETTIAKQYGETLDNLDDLQKIVKKTISPKRKPTKFIKDAKSSVVDSWKQMGKDGFRRQMYEPMEFDAEIPKSVKLGFGFGAGLALFQVAVIGSAIGLGMLLNKE